MSEDLSDGQLEAVQCLPATSKQVGDELGISTDAAGKRLNRAAEKGVVEKDGDTWVDPEADEDERGDLLPREEYIYKSLPKSEEALAEDLDVSIRVVQIHLEEIERKGWSLEGDDSGNWLGPDQDHLRSSEHTGTRTRKANKWWQRRHDELVHEFQRLEWPRTQFQANEGNEDWVLHMTDLHAGDFVRRDDGRVVYETDMIPDVVDHITGKSLSLADKHGSEYDTGHLLWGGDFVTNEGIYEGQHEDLDSWLDEQHNVLLDPLIKQIKAFSERFDNVKVVTMIGNHGENRASGTSKQANADLILYKSVRNTIAQIREHSDGLLDNVEFVIGEAKPYRNFFMRDGAIKGHLRHGQNRKPQAVTAKGNGDWVNTLLDHEFQICYVGHRHISGRVPWSGPPIFYTASPKPAGEFVERIGSRGPKATQGMATTHGVSDEGVTGVYPIDARDFY